MIDPLMSRGDPDYLEAQRLGVLDGTDHWESDPWESSTAHCYEIENHGVMTTWLRAHVLWTNDGAILTAVDLYLDAERTKIVDTIGAEELSGDQQAAILSLAEAAEFRARDEARARLANERAQRIWEGAR